MRHFLKVYALFFAVFLFGLQLSAKEPVVTICRTNRKPIIDGVLDDSVWLNVEPITGFMQYHPVEGTAPSESTELYIAYDKDNFYLAFRCYDSEIHEVRATMTQRESWDHDDCVGFAFDTYNSEREGFLFNINPYGIPSDFIWHHDGFCDNGWDADLRSKGKICSDCWCVECAVPFKSLRMPTKDAQEWGFYALRSIKHKDEFLVWPPRTHRIPNLLAQASLLKGIRGIKTGRHFAVLPYMFSSYTENVDENDRPFDLGFDLRYGVTSNLMLDITLNPDYSQIEADPDRIELSERYAQTLREKRPFFTEGTDIFASNQWLFYSRRITNPIAGLKLTGKIGKNRIGFLSAVNDEVDSGKENYYNLLRGKAEILDESSVGFTMINKDNFKDATYNRALSVDGLFRFKNVYSLKTQVTGTWTKSDDHRTNAVGYNLNFERFGGSSYHSIWYNDFPEDFEAQTGAMWEVIGYREIGIHNGLFIRKPFEPVNIFELHGGVKGRFNYEDELVEDYLWASVEGSSHKVWTKLEFFKNHESQMGQDFRYSGFEYELWNTPARYIDHYLSLLWGGAIHYDSTMVTGWRYRLFYNFTLKPVSKVVYNISISREDFYREYGGERLDLQTILWNKLSYQMAPAMFIRGIYEYDSKEKKSDASLLFAFEYSPLSNIYIGANFGDISVAEQTASNVEIFAKIGYLWRL